MVLAQGNWIAVLPAEAVAAVPTDRAVQLLGPAGTITVHNCRCVHRSRPNVSAAGRPLLLQTFSPASCAALPHGANGSILRGETRHGDQLICGRLQPTVWDARAGPLGGGATQQEAPWMPDPAAVVYDWERVASLLRPLPP